MYTTPDSYLVVLLTTQGGGIILFVTTNAIYRTANFYDLSNYTQRKLYKKQVKEYIA